MKRKFGIVVYTCNTDGGRINGVPVNKGDVTGFGITDRTDAEMQAVRENLRNKDAIVDHISSAWFPVNRFTNAEEQELRAKAVCEYMNKVEEAKYAAMLSEKVAL